jgi:hypothetical protein
MWLVTIFLLQWPGFDSTAGHVGFVVNKLALQKVFFEDFSLPCQFSFYQMFHTHIPSGTGTVGQLMTYISSVLSLIPPHEIIIITV